MLFRSGLLRRGTSLSCDGHYDGPAGHGMHASVNRGEGAATRDSMLCAGAYPCALIDLIFFFFFFFFLNEKYIYIYTQNKRKNKVG